MKGLPLRSLVACGLLLFSEPLIQAAFERNCARTLSFALRTPKRKKKTVKNFSAHAQATCTALG